MMKIETAILKNIEKLPDSIKQAVFLYTEFLANHYSESELNSEDKSEEYYFVGSMKKTFFLPLPDNFSNFPKETDTISQADYEQKYGYGSLAGQIIMSDDFDEPLVDMKDYM